MVINRIKKGILAAQTSLYKNSLFISSASLITAISGFLFWNIAARLYDPTTVGVATAILGALNMISVFSMLGFNSSVIRYYPEYGKKAMGSSLSVVIILSLLVALLYLFFVRDVDEIRGFFSPIFFIIIIFSSIGLGAYNLFYPYSIAQRKAKHGAIMCVALSLRVLLLFLFLRYDTLGIVVAFFVALLLADLYAVFALKKISLNIDTKYLRESFRFSVGNYVADVANRVPMFLMPTLVLALIGSEEAAYFYIAYTIGNIALFVPVAISTSFFAEGSHGLKSMKNTMKKAIILSEAYVAGVLAITLLFGRKILGLFGPEYAGGYNLLCLMLLGAFFVVLFRFYIASFNIQKKAGNVVITSVTRAALFLSISYVLIPRSGIEGVGWAWLIGNAIATGIAVIIHMQITNTTEPQNDVI